MKDVICADLPDLSREYALPAERIARYQRDGHVLLRGVAAPAEVAAYRSAIVEAATRYNTETRPLSARDTYGKAFLQIMNLWEKDDQVRRFVLARRFGKLAADLMGVDGVRLYHDQALFKEPGGGHTPWHQDHIYWPLDTRHTITMWMPLVDIPAAVGSMTFVSGSQALDFPNMMEISDESEQVLQQFVDEHDLPQSTYGALTAGDATFHNGWVMHRAPGNPTAMMREVMTIIYVADGAKVLQPVPPVMQRDLDTWMPGLGPGDVVASQRNPLIYSRIGSSSGTS
jgi:ectoine hydroxylase-related dioxygenase (phytanoyl-CoA dioxygenase family)